MIRDLIELQISDLAKSMASPIRCGGADRIDGYSISHMGSHCVPAHIVEGQRAILDNWFEVHDHNECIRLKNKIPKRVRNERK